MKTLERVLAGAATLFLMGGLADSFVPFQDWKAAVMAGDQAVLTKLYAGNLEDACRYWAGMKSSGVTGFNPKVLTVAKREGKTALVLRVEALKEGQPVVASVAQYWASQAGGWHIIAEKRGEFIFERSDLRTADVRGFFVDFLEAALDLRHDFTVLCREVQKFYWHLVRLPGVMRTGGGRNIAAPVFPRRWLERGRHWSPTRRRQPSRPRRSQLRT